MEINDFIDELDIAIKQDGHDIYVNRETATMIKNILLLQTETDRGDNVFDMIDLFYTNKHLYEKIKRHKEKDEQKENISKTQNKLH